MSRTERIERSVRRAAALTYLDDSRTSERARKSIALSLSQLVATTVGCKDAAEFRELLFASIADGLRAQDLPAWAKIVEEYATSPNPSTNPRLVVLQILVARAAGGLCARHLDDSTAHFIYNLRHYLYFDTVDFAEAMTTALSAGNTGAQDLVILLRERAELGKRTPAKLGLIATDVPAKAGGEASEARRFREVWEGPRRRSIVWLNDSLLFEVMRRIDPEAYLDLIEAYPLTEGIYVFLEAADHHAAFEELVALLGNTRTAFDSDGRWKQDMRAAFILLDLLRERLFECEFENGEPPETFRSGLENVLRAILARPDAVPLAYAWLQRLISARGRSWRPARMAPDVDAVAALAAITDAFAKLFPDLPDPFDWIQAEETIWRNERIYTLVAVHASRSPANEAKVKSILENVLLGDLVGSFGMDRLLTAQNGFESRVLGSAVAALDDSAAWFDDLWARLFWQRDRARRYVQNDDNLPNVGQVICTWSALALGHLPLASERATALWTSVETAVRESSLTDWYRQSNDIWSLLLRFLGALQPKTFPDDPSPGAPGSLDDFLASWLQVDPNLALLAVTMRKYGASPASLERAGVSSELLRRILEDGASGRYPVLSKPDVDLVLGLEHHPS